MRRLIVLGVLAAVILVFPNRTTIATAVSLDGAGNNEAHPAWGSAGSRYRRVAPARYADGVARAVSGPAARFISNRIFNDAGQNLFSENGISQWGWVWGQFVDHDIGLRVERGGENAPIAFARNDALEGFTNDLGTIDFARTPAARGTGVSSPREHINTLSSYIDGSGVYGVDAERLDWLRVGPRDGDPTNNRATLLLPNDELPRVGSRGDASRSPATELFGPLLGRSDAARVAGDVRVNENAALTAVHTLFAREHNRIVAALPSSLSEEEKFQIARRVVSAEIQYVTYTEFLPALGIALPPYRGYDAVVDPSLANEFSVVGYRGHSMVHGQFDVIYEKGDFTNRQLIEFRARGIEPRLEDEQRSLQVPLTVAFGNPDVLGQLGIGRFLASLSAERQYRNDEQIDNALRSVLFQIPRPGIPDPSVCGQPIVRPECFSAVADLGAIDIERARDHGMPSYNELRRAYGLSPKTSFTAITGEATDRFPADAEIDAADPINDPDILDFVKLTDENGAPVDIGSAAGEENPVAGVRRTTLAARLRAVYRTVGAVDAFVGMLSEPHRAGSEFGELQDAIWKRQFASLRDGDRFFFANDPTLATIASRFGISYRSTLGEIIERNTDALVPAAVFFATDSEEGHEEAEEQSSPTPQAQGFRRRR
jgi:hypothetical protein